MLISFDALAGYGIKFTRTTVRRLARAGKFPKPVRLGEQQIAWREGEVLEYIASLPSADDAPLSRTKIKQTKTQSVDSRRTEHRAIARR